MKIVIEIDETKEYLGVAPGLAIILKYDPYTSVGAAFDQIWVGDYEETVKQMTLEEKEVMRKSGWEEDEDAWFRYL